jgi:hypothetical protein
MCASHHDLAAALLLASRAASFATGDGPRAYVLTPTDSQILAAYALFLNGNQALNPGISSNNPGLELELGVFQYTRTLALGDPSCGVFLIAPYGSTDGTYNLPLISRTGNSSVRRSAIPSGLISKSLSINAT